MNVLVTGHQGYIGRHTVKALESAGHFVKYTNEQVDAVIHLGAMIDVAESVRDPQKYFHYNVVNTIELLDACLANHVKYFVFASSAAQIGSPYGIGKAFIEQVLEYYSGAYDLRFVALRYFNVAGCDENHEPETHLIPNLLRAAKCGTPVTIYGDGSCVRDYVHVLDVAAANVSALEYLRNGGESKVVEVGSGVGHSVVQVVRKVEKITGHSIIMNYAPARDGDVPKLVSKSWSARSLDEIIRSAWESMQ